MSYRDLYLSKSPLIISPNEDSDPAAIIYGIPFDSTHSYKPGTRFGPDAIRDAFNNIEIFHPQFQIDLASVNIQDLGNIHHTVNVEEMTDMVNKLTGELIKKDRLLVILGGEHSLTYGTYTAFPKDTGYIVFDAHFDLRSEYAGVRLSHAAYLRRVVEKNGAENIIHVGARSFVGEELAFLKEHKIKTITEKDIRDGKGPKLVNDMLSTFKKTYVSVDLDVLDPAFAPGVGNPEAVGITSRELFDMIYAMEGHKIACLDVVELNPTYDTGATASLAAKLISTMIAMNIK
ncbi:agmatinase [Candidatus Nitrosotenuis sp. DW1]|uniref:agmatinase n=1 Tax=Candidatus Nitrosotenuis sp. DW1 TaxID=2259672 RepID=UPI0015C74F14|nr:agmatinase [Candidatus Nitrosotenuis sp. DW1]QLH08993.1 agmatinase [Candidatus Nitrosotenuis sp. DW1]